MRTRWAARLAQFYTVITIRLGMHSSTRRIALIAFTSLTLVVVALVGALSIRRATPNRTLMKTCGIAVTVARRLGMHSLQNEALNWRDSFFQSELDSGVRIGELSRVSVQLDQAVRSFTADVTAFAKTNNVRLVFTQTLLSTNQTGGTCTVYVLTKDAETVRNYMESRSQVPTNRSTE